jgi:acyl dehydratase
MAQIYWEDVDAGMEIPSLTKHPTSQQLVKWAGASGDFYQIHYDQEFAKSNRLKGVIVHGLLKVSFLGQMLTDWIGEHGTLKKIGCQHRGMDYPDEDLTCRGKVIRKYVEQGEHLVECEIWTENPRKEKTAPGTAVVALPVKKP